MTTGTASYSPGLVLSHGVFDVIHPGHVAYFQRCRELGDRLVVGVTADAYVAKGPGRPMFSADARAAVLRSLRMIDEVRVVDAPSAAPLIRELRPEVYAKGEEYERVDLAGHLDEERVAVEEAGGRLVFTSTMLGSSTAWINRQAPPWPAPAEAWLANVRAEHSMEEVLAWFELAKQARVEVIGERIRDEYVYVEPLGKSAKETLVSFEPDGTDAWPGGGEVVAAHLSAYCGGVRYSGGEGYIIKRRYVQKAFTHKVFQTVEAKALRPQPVDLDEHDLAVVGDFGHGLFPDSESCEAVLKQAKWLGLTVQSNSANWGFNVVTKWPRADYVVVDENEAQLAFHRREPGDRLVSRLQMALGAETAAITMGHHGSVFIQGDRVERVPALTDRAVDRLGAGDAFLAWTAPFVRLGAPLPLIGLIGSAAAALHVGKPGNPPLSKAEVLGFVKAMMTA